MTRRVWWACGLAAMAMSSALGGQTTGSATGKGTIDNRGTPVPFVPRLASAEPTRLEPNPYRIDDDAGTAQSPSLPM
jgi:hypothetical protein